MTITNHLKIWEPIPEYEINQLEKTCKIDLSIDKIQAVAVVDAAKEKMKSAIHTTVNCNSVTTENCYRIYMDLINTAPTNVVSAMLDRTFYPIMPPVFRNITLVYNLLVVLEHERQHNVKAFIDTKKYQATFLHLERMFSMIPGKPIDTVPA